MPPRTTVTTCRGNRKQRSILICKEACRNDAEPWRLRSIRQCHDNSSSSRRCPKMLIFKLENACPLATSQKHLRCTMVGPDSSYSPLEIHICWKVLKEERIEPPIHTEYLRSGGATTLIFIVEGARAVSSLVILSPIPANMVVPPESTQLAYKSLRMSISHFMID